MNLVKRPCSLPWILFWPQTGRSRVSRRIPYYWVVLVGWYHYYRLPLSSNLLPSFKLAVTDMLILQTLLASVAICSPIQLAKRAVIVDDISTLSSQYDYVIIGGGTSGLTVADRLTENPQSTYLFPSHLGYFNWRLSYFEKQLFL